MPPRRSRPAPVVGAVVGGLTFGLMTLLLGDGGPGYALLSGLVFGGVWLTVGTLSARRRRG